MSYNQDVFIWREGKLTILNELFPRIGGSGLIHGVDISDTNYVIAATDFSFEAFGLFLDPHFGKPRSFLLELPITTTQ